MATRTDDKRKPRSKTGISINEFSDHFADILIALDQGAVQGIAMAVVTADSPNSGESSAMSSTLIRDGVTALILRDRYGRPADGVRTEGPEGLNRSVHEAIIIAAKRGSEGGGPGSS